MSVVSLFVGLIDWLICPQKPNRLQEMQVQVFFSVAQHWTPLHNTFINPIYIDFGLG